MTDIFHGRSLDMDLVKEESPRTAKYKAVEHLNAAVNILRHLKKYDIADLVKENIRLLNTQ